VCTFFYVTVDINASHTKPEWDRGKTEASNRTHPDINHTQRYLTETSGNSAFNVQSPPLHWTYENLMIAGKIIYVCNVQDMLQLRFSHPFQSTQVKLSVNPCLQVVN
jgi:hypothetical protein